MAEELSKETRQEVREEKQRMKQHGKGLAKIYKDAITKRGK